VQGKSAACRPISVGRRRAVGEDRADDLAGVEGDPIGALDREEAHRILARDGDGGRA
jgi:hypothetical protein